MTTHVRLETTGRTARVVFHEERGIQTFSRATRERLAEVVTELEDREGLRVVVFEAQGRTFIAGADIRELVGLNPATAESESREGQSLMNRIARLPAVTVAAIHAACAGGGCELALACDLRMAAAAAKIGLPETSIGVLPGWGGTVRATRLLGGAAARRLILAGDLLPAAEALRLGLVDSVAPDESFREAVQARIDLLLSRSPTGQRWVKRLIAEFESADVRHQLTMEAQAFARCFAHGEAQEGLRAFLEKRPPDWEPFLAE